MREGDKFDALTRIIDVEPEFYGIVFSRTRTGADDIVAKLLERGYAAEVLHGDISQAQREKILGKFKKKQVNILVATDVAARGIDVSNLTHVINYSLPQDSDAMSTASDARAAPVTRERPSPSSRPPRCANSGS